MENKEVKKVVKSASVLDEKGKTTYLAAGQEVTLSYQIVRDFLTKGSDNVTNQDLVQFISICKYNQLNPFLNEAYLIKYGTAPAQMVVSKEALMKRADSCDNYQGIQAGIIVERGDEIIELEGCFYKKEDKLVGAWAKVYRSDRKYPVVSKVNLSEYDTGKSVWRDKVSTMISKVAKVQALREAFPAQLGAMYTQEESGIKEAQFIDVSNKVNEEKKESANKERIGFEKPLDITHPIANDIHERASKMKMPEIKRASSKVPF